MVSKSFNFMSVMLVGNFNSLCRQNIRIKLANLSLNPCFMHIMYDKSGIKV